ncbi:hypothetical protein [Rubellimicrobium roseum]|uniref:ATP-binding protein n=1 Tax=Rubellimicrobium roseum TaxID=687525 RepID=A0A5C4N329_9RHOB|nr:hypothetical protein [Rubellimicrobium roseum]TNC59160.1 hypothetical protein FHG71_23105 [Rubellimicrobium roseum]
MEKARLQGVIGIAFDKCQHVFSKGGGRTNGIFLDSFKTLLKDSRWPLMLILSGVPELGNYVQKEEQLARLLRPIRFDPIHLPQDMDEMNRLAYTYADRAGLCFDALSSTDFFYRLAYAFAGRWGLVIELIIEAFVQRQVSGATKVT